MIVSSPSLVLLAEEHMNSFYFLFHLCKISFWMKIYFVFYAAVHYTVKDDNWWIRFEDVDTLVKISIWSNNYAKQTIFFSNAIASVQKFESLCSYKVSVILFALLPPFYNQIQCCGFLLRLYLPILCGKWLLPMR